MTRTRLELLQWFGLLGGGLAFAIEHVIGFGISDAGCNVAGSQWGLNATLVQVLLAVATGIVVVLAWCAALLVFRATQRFEQDAPGPNGRLRFFAEAALLGNVLFLVIVVLDAAGTVYLSCHS